MATTTNFGWSTPDDTDLVKDGALAIRTLGSAIDTSLVDLKGGTTGQVLSKTSNTDMDFTWVTTDDADAIQNSIVDAKGDLIAASADNTPARLAVGSNGDTLVADSAASTGLRWQGNYSAAKNAIINGDFRINQRSFTSATANGSYGFDRFYLTTTDGTTTYSAQTFTAGAAPVSGYEAINYARLVSSGQTATNAQSVLRQAIEDVRTFAGRTVTVSFWARSGSGTPAIAVELIQDFGSGGSSAVTGTISTKQTISTSWTRYTYTGTLPSISGKTIGTSSNLQLAIWVSAGSNFDARTQTLGIQSNTFDIWGVQVETGNVATAFQTATGTLQGELAACQRYYWRSPQSPMVLCNLSMFTATSAYGIIQFQTAMRSIPVLEQGSGTNYFSVLSNNTSDSFDSIAGITDASVYSSRIDITSGIAVTAGQSGWLRLANASAYIAFSAEL
jgi:hypothetical protein